MVKKVLIAVLGIIGIAFLALSWFQQSYNVEVTQKLRDHSDPALSARVMLLTLPDGKTMPVNYLREGKFVFVGADGRWWRSITTTANRVEMIIEGRQLIGRGKIIDNQPGYKAEIFARLRPDAPKWLPDWLNGVLIEIKLE